MYKSLLALLGLFFLFSPCNIWAQGTQDIDLRVNIAVISSPIKKVTASITEQIGFNVQLIDIDDNFSVSGSFKNIAVEELYKRLFKGYNIAISIDETSRTIRVQSLGGIISHRPTQAPKKQHTNLHPTEENTKSEQAPDLSPETTDIDPFTGLSHKKIKSLHAQQTKNIERENADMSRIDPFTNITAGELKELHRKQNEAIKNNTTKE
jgi:hypothetical protein